MSDVHTGRRWLASVVGVATLTALLVAVPQAQQAQAAPCDPPIANPVLCENTKTGNPPSEWDVSGAGSSTIQGFATDISVDNGATVQFKVKTPASAYRLDIYRMGYYAGNGARLVATVSPSASLPQNQPNCLTDDTTGLVDCGNWGVSASWAVPADAVSGIYFAKLVRTDGTAGASHIFFVVRDDASRSDLLFQTSDTSWQAYNAYGGNSLYTGSPAGRAYKVSYNRPITTRDNAPEDFVFNAEYPMVRWLERNGYDVSYTTGVDTARYGSLLLNHRVFMSVGHDEYWSGDQRANVEAARDAGVNLAFFSGNEMFWKTRWEPAIDSSARPYRTLVSYKETHANAVIDPADPPTWTGTWRDPRFSPPADGGRPENALTGTIFTANCCTNATISVTGAYRQLRFWRNTRVASLSATGSTTLTSGMLNYEWDSDLDNGARPAGLLNMSSTTVSGQSVLQDYGSTYRTGTAVHNLTLYRAPSGALVFGAGTVQWSWALDNNHDRGSAAVDTAVQQATVNLFADMGVQPGSRQSGLVAATQTTDTTPPVSTVTAPTAGSNVALDADTTVTGTASDTGGVVAGVEVSVDGGTTWRKATGTSNWTYTWRPSTAGTYSIRVRAVDDSGRLETPGAGITVTAGGGGGGGGGGGSGTCPCSIWSSSTTPGTVSDPDTGAIEIGVKFQASRGGFITGVRFYKGSTNTGTHVGRLWTSTGTQLASVTFTGESASGWQQATFSSPVAVTANTTYVASYYAPNGRYSADENYFGTATTNGPLTALATGTSPNGVYRYGVGGGFPTSSYRASNYWVDVVFDSADTTAPTVTSRTPAAGATGVATSTTVTATFSEPVQAATVAMGLTDPAGAAVTGATSYDAATQRATFTPSTALTAGTTYAATVSGAKDAAGNTMTPLTWSFATIAPDTTAPSLTARTPADGATGVPTTASVTATFSEAVQPTTVTVALTGPNNAAVSGTQSYDAATQRVTFNPSAALAASTSYVAQVTGAQDAAGNTMTAVTWTFTTAAQDTTAPTVAARTPTAGATDVATSASVTATFSEAVQASTVAITLTAPGGGAVAGTQSYDPATLQATLRPASALANSTTYTVNVTGAQDLAGNTMTAVSWSFTTAAPSSSGCPCSIWQNSATPQTAAANDTAAVEVGVKFRASISGYVTGIRFYKATTNTGTHVGRLWSGTGTQLASVTFLSETTSGWQQALFSSPVAVSAGTTYVASYYAPSGRYSTTARYFATATTNGPLTALSNGTDGVNGVYRYGSGGGFPTSGFQSTNYWVDVVFDTSANDVTPPTIVARAPAADASAVPVGTAVSATFSEPVQAATITMGLTGPNSSVVAGQTVYDAATRTATFTPAAVLATSTTYVANVSGASDTAGNPMSPASWTFTTAATSSGCPCSLWPTSATPTTAAAADSSAVSVGVRFRPATSGYVTALRFYKGPANTGTHVGHLWTTSGQLLGSVTFSGETASGWQQAAFSAPIAVAAGTTYIASYYAPAGGYALNGGYFAAADWVSGPLTAPRDASGAGNGLYRYGGDAFPTSTYQSSNYWVDVVFDTTAADTIKPTVTQRNPAAGSSGVGAGATVSATFSETMQTGSISMALSGPNGAVSTTASYDTATLTQTLTPTAPLAYSTTYTASVSGGRDAAGNQMDPLTWTFTTAAAPPPPLDQGPGGPIAVVTSAANPFTGYLAEILRAEGLNSFTSLPVGNVSATALAPYDVVVLGETTLTDAQATDLSTWVTNGGNLIAMRPDTRLSGLLGITKGTGTVAEGYLKIDTATSAGAGITADTMQFHGTADRYSLSGASAVAALYTNATTSAGNPAVTLRSVGTNGGQAAAFTYDLARSTVYLRQGNPAWAGQERDGDADNVIRSDDLYFGGSATDWVNLGKVSIPQADEQQRLLANLIELMNADRKPLPRFWYFPRSAKAVVVATGDDHGNGGTSSRFDTYAANSPAGCSVSDWTCLRYTSFTYPGTLSDSAASAYQAQGFEVALHPQNGCRNFTAATLQTTYADQLASFAAANPGVTAPVSGRFHCLVWSDWFSQPTTELQNGIRLDANYYYWPGSWIQDRPGFMTGSGIPMRYANTDGSMIDVYQAATQMTDESGQSYPFTVNTLLDNALGAPGYYGAFTANMHTDNVTSFPSDQLLASATARGVPIVTAKQLLAWLDGRNGSSFGSIAWSANTLSFSVAAGAGANGLTGMLPTTGPGGTALTGITRGGNAVSFARTTIKGVEYAMFAAAAGSYQAAYGASGTAAAITSPSATADSSGTTFLSWRSSSPATTVVNLGTSPRRLTTTVRVAGRSTAHLASTEGLEPGRRYYYRVTSTDARGRRSVWPSLNEPAATFRVPARDRKAPRVGAVRVLPLPDGTATVSWSTNEPSDSRVVFGTRRGRLAQSRIDSAVVRRHQVVLTGLRPGRAYWFRVVSADPAGNRATGPRPQRFVSAGAGVAVHTAQQFRTGRLGGARVLDTGFGALTVATGRRTATYTSNILDARQFVTWDRATWQVSVPSGAGVKVWVRTGSRARPDGSWSSWRRVPVAGARITAPASRLLQYRVRLTASASGRPVLTAIGFTHSGGPPPAAPGMG